MESTYSLSRTSYLTRTTPASIFNQFRNKIDSQNRDWDFVNQDTQYSTHNLHTYLAAMNPPLARRLIQDYVPRGSSVLDPFNGGGAVLVEAVLNHREAIGRDVNKLAVLIASAKTTHLPQEEILALGNIVLKQARAYTGKPLHFEKSDYIHYWFKPEIMLPLSGLRYAIDRIQDAALKQLFQVIFSATVRDVSLTHRNEIRLRRLSEEEQRKFNPNVFEKFEARVRNAAARVSQLPQGARADVAIANVLQLPFREHEFHAIVCSPPYGDERNGVPYVQFAKNMLLWLGFTIDTIREDKQETLGWGKGERGLPPSPELEHLLDVINDNPTAVREAIAFYADYYVALQQMARVVRERVIIVIGQRVLHKTIFNNALITAELMAEIGLKLENLHTRQLPTKRLPRLREYGGGIDQEIILIFHK